MANRTCSVPDCERASESLGYCQKHYVRMRKTGTTDDPVRPTLAERFNQCVDKSATCWLWTGYIRRDGYGIINANGIPTGAHRVAFEAANGEIPKGMRVDHICHNPPCVNPEHLRLVTIKQNSENYTGLMVTNSSGVRGVWWHKGGKKWSVQVTHNKKRYSGGLHSSLADAEAAAIALRNKLHTHNDKDRVA